MNCSIRKALPKDVQAACSVLRRSISECCIEDHHNDPEILSAWLRNKTPENLTSWFSSPANFPVVATSGKDVVGVGLLSTKGEVLLCYVLPEVRFAGGGRFCFVRWSRMPEKSAAGNSPQQHHHGKGFLFA